eukprot:Awhi_evm1s6319
MSLESNSMPSVNTSEEDIDNSDSDTNVINNSPLDQFRTILILKKSPRISLGQILFFVNRSEPDLTEQSLKNTVYAALASHERHTLFGSEESAVINDTFLKCLPGNLPLKIIKARNTSDKNAVLVDSSVVNQFDQAWRNHNSQNRYDPRPTVLNAEEMQAQRVFQRKVPSAQQLRKTKSSFFVQLILSVEDLTQSNRNSRQSGSSSNYRRPGSRSHREAGEEMDTRDLSHMGPLERATLRDYMARHTNPHLIK